MDSWGKEELSSEGGGKTKNAVMALTPTDVNKPKSGTFGKNASGAMGMKKPGGEKTESTHCESFVRLGAALSPDTERKRVGN